MPLREIHPQLFPARHPLDGGDARLVRLAKSGNDAAFAELYRKHSTMAAKMIFRIVKNADDVDDVLQDAFVSAFTHIKSFDERAKFSTWLTRIAINNSLMLLRKNRIRSAYSIDEVYHDDDTALHLQIHDPSPDPEEICLQNNSIAELRRAVGRLPKILQKAAALRYSEGIPTKDAAELLGISVPAAKSRMNRATMELRLRMASGNLS